MIALQTNGTNGNGKPVALVTTTAKQKTRSVIPYEEALRLLLSAEAAQSHPATIRAELPAIISHWLQRPQHDPLILSKEAGLRWRIILATFFRTENRNTVELPRLPQNIPFQVDFSGVPFPPVKKAGFTFVDLFAGIGGFRIALQELGGQCLFSCEWDKHSKETYSRNFAEVPFGDIRQFTGEEVSDEQLEKLIPDHDILAAGFPCQPFSRAGVSARSALGQEHGFLCEVQGTLFFDLMRIAKVKRPKVLFLENVKNLQSHDGGKTFARIRETIEKDLGYSFSTAVIDASPLVPQKRKRCYMVCLRDRRKTFSFPDITGVPRQLRSILEPVPSDWFTLSDRMWQGHIKRTQRNLDRGAGFTAFEAKLDAPANTLVARYYKDGKECLVPQQGSNPRMLTPRECARLQGFPEKFIPHKWNMQAYRQFGNSVAVPVIGKIAEQITRGLRVKR